MPFFVALIKPLHTPFFVLSRAWIQRVPNFTYSVHDALANWLGGAAFPAAPSTLYAGLLTAAPDPDGTGATEPQSGYGYARQPVTLTKSHADGVTTLVNAGALVFGPATSGWTPANYFGLFDQDGALLLYGRLRSTRAAENGQLIVFAQGAISIGLR